MRFIFTFLLMTNLVSFLNAQEDSLYGMTQRGGGSTSRLATCPQWIYHPGPPANRVLNPIFAAIDPTGLGPFEVANNIDYWGASHGTPQFNVMHGVPANFPTGANCASMWSARTRAATLGEGIIGNLGGSNFTTSAIEANKQYVLSFYRSFISEPNNPTPALDVMNIRLLKCQDAIHTATTTIPAVPTNSQQVYCETNINAGFQRVVVTFTANDDYDLIWIYPEQTTTLGQAWLNVSMVELAETSVLPNTLSGPSGLYLGLGPKLFNTANRWYDQNNILIANLNLGATEYDNYNTSPPPAYVPAGVSFGPIAQIPGNPQTYILKVTFLNNTVTNNTCSVSFSGTLTSASSPVVWRSPIQTGTATVEGDLEIQAANRSRIWINNSLSEESNGNIYVYDLTGKAITSLLNRQIRKGRNVYNLDRVIPSGIYIVKVVSSQKVYAKKIFINDL